jgi:hypothetical protein
MIAKSMAASHLLLLHMDSIISMPPLKCRQLQRRIVSVMRRGPSHATLVTTLLLSIALAALALIPMQQMAVVLTTGQVTRRPHMA